MFILEKGVKEMAIQMEVWGKYACFSRPEMKVERVSYDVMTPSAARGILEAVYWHPGLRWHIDRIHVINPIQFSQLKFLYPLKTLVFPAFSPSRFGPFPSFFPLREEMRETFFRLSLQPYPAALRKFAWPLWWRERKCSLWYLHQNVPAAPAHPWVLPREREGWSYMYASTDGSENHPYPRSSFGSIGTHC